MVTLLDINELQKKSRFRFLFHIIALIVLISLTITGTIFSLLFSSLDYTWNLVINIVVTTLVIVFAIFYFLNIFPLVKHYYFYYKNLTPFNLEHRRRMVYLKEIERKVIDNVSYRVVQFIYKEGENEYNDNLYLLDTDYSFKDGRAYKLDTYHNVIVNLEELD